MSDSENGMLVSAPRRIKHGKSSGEDFNVQNISIKMKICWEPETKSGLETSFKGRKGEALVLEARVFILVQL